MTGNESAVLFYKQCASCEGISYDSKTEDSWYCPYCDRELTVSEAFMIELAGNVC